MKPAPDDEYAMPTVSEHPVSSVGREELTRALRVLGAGVDARSALRAETAVKLRFAEGELELQSASGPVAVQVKLPTEGPLREGSVCVRHSALSKAVGACKTEIIELRADSEHRLICRSGQRRLRLTGFADNEFPELQTADLFTELASFTGDELAFGLAAAVRSASLDELRPALCSVAVDFQDVQQTMVCAADPYRLAALAVDADVHDQSFDTVLIALPGAKALAKELRTVKPEEVKLSVLQSEHGVVVNFAYDRVRWLIHSPQGRFPDWRTMIDLEGEELHLHHREIGAALEAISAIARKSQDPHQAIPLRLRLSAGGEVSLYYRDSEVGELVEDLDRARWTGSKELEIGFSPQFLSETVTTLGSGEITALIKNSLSPVLFSAGEVRCLLMPVRLATSTGETDADDTPEAAPAAA